MNDLHYQPQQTATMPNAEQLKHLRKLVEKAKVGMFTTIDRAQELRSRPLHTVQMDDDGSLWFVVATASPKTQEVNEHEGKVCLAYANHGDQEYVSITGHASLVRDSAMKEKIWNKMIDVWFPKGDKDPNVAMLKVVPERAEYWDGPSNTVTQLYAFAKAMATGNKDAFGENAKLKF
ncbi:pyridoxamine 5'-phosphate oxidase family protein [Hydrocarboniphaga sp.]|uniref:pyridoxamine 5'-phosphate oxidase family protein n=1 Tax=Hydrocarboniphaga sp. TaxID=2033016 RepID=UPI003D11B262